MTAAELYTALKTTTLPVAYARFEEPTALPYIVYMGDGQGSFLADNTVYHKQNTYRIEYYFKTKNESTEADIEKVLTDKGLIYSKSEDIYIEEEDAFEIYYQI